MLTKNGKHFFCSKNVTLSKTIKYMYKSSFLFGTTFNLSASGGPKVVLQDNTQYAVNGIDPSKVQGIVKAQRGSSIFQNNTDYNFPDISPSSSTSFQFNLPVDSNGNVPQASYLFTYSIRVLDELFLQQVATMSNANTISFGSSVNYDIQISTILGQASAVKLQLFNSGNVSLGEVVVTGSSFTPNVQSITLETFANFENVHYARIVTYYTRETSYNYCYTFPGVSLSVFPDCFRSQLTVVDNTVFSASYTIISRTLTVQFPKDLNGNPVSATVVTENASITVGPNIWTGGYTISSQINANYLQSDGLVVNKTIVGYLYPDVQCDPGLCCISPCLKSLQKKYQEAVTVGSNQTGWLREVLFQAGIYINRYLIYMNCQDTGNATCVAAELIAYLNGQGCECDCKTCGTSSESVEIQPFGV